MASVQATTSAAPSGTSNPQLVGYGTDKDAYNRGDTAKGYITLKNVGSTAISDATVSVSVVGPVPGLRTRMTLVGKDHKVSGLNIQHRS